MPGVADEAVAAAVSSVPHVAAVEAAGELVYLPHLSFRFCLQLAGAAVVVFSH